MTLRKKKFASFRPKQKKYASSLLVGQKCLSGNCFRCSIIIVNSFHAFIDSFLSGKMILSVSLFQDAKRLRQNKRIVDEMRCYPDSRRGSVVCGRRTREETHTLAPYPGSSHSSWYEPFRFGNPNICIGQFSWFHHQFLICLNHLSSPNEKALDCEKWEGKREGRVVKDEESFIPIAI